MTDPLNSTTSEWVRLAAAADSGDLFLNAEAARRCNDACEVYLAKLRSNLRITIDMPRVEGMGRFNSGIQLANTFSDKMSGGENSLANVLRSHIDVVMTMQAVFKKFFTDTADTDRDNASGISAQGPR